LQVAEYDPEADRRALAELAAWCHRFSPSVSLDEAETPLALQLEVGGVAQHFGGEAALAMQVQAEFAARGWKTRLGLADAWGGAWAAAVGSAVRTDGEPLDNERGCLGSSAASPQQTTVIGSSSGVELSLDPRHPVLPQRHPTSKIAIVPAGAELSAYAALPLAVLRLPGALLELLEELGLSRIGQLFQLPRPDLAARLGPLVGQRLDQLSGAATEVLFSQPFQETDRAELLFEPTDRQAVVTAALERLLAQLAVRLAGRRQGALALCCRLTGPGIPPAEFEVRFYRPNSQASHWVELLGLALERRVLPGLIEKVEVQITSAGPLEFRQQNLFGDQERGRDDRLVGLLIDRLAGRLGRNAVLTPRLVPEAQPELACRLEPLVGSVKLAAMSKPPVKQTAKKGGKRGAASAGQPQELVRTADPTFFRPLRLWAQAEAVTVLGVAPQGEPVRFRWRRYEHVVERAWGPERIETGWWRGRYVRRDYYRVETTSGERYWLFRRRRDGRWFLHGAFA
jgi:protein ImuB